MAEQTQDVHVMRTSQFTDTEGDMRSLSPQEDGEEPREVDPDAYEERFRVDRRKLEQMLQGGEHDRQKAEDFFIKVMEDTDTQITWPSKLKIGAKSKKDPHIKVAGKPEDVRRAKELIMAVLDTKSNRVTLKMDVSHTEHSHVIGKGGNNIKRVMAETGCHIHFPDSNRGTQGEKSNQVSIAGQPMGVELARAAIRELLPLVFMFELPITGVLQPVPDSSSPIVQRIQQTYNVTVTFKQRPRMYFTTVIVRGSVNNANGVKEATLSLMEHLTGNIGVMGNISVSMQLEIAPQHHLFMMGRGGINIKQIMQKTGASVHFPDPNTVTPQRKGTVYITGGIDSVFLARQQLIGCLPLVLMFDMKEECDIDQVTITQLMEQLDIFISIKPKPKQPSKSVIVKSIERNAGNMYEARRILLGLERNEKSMPPLIPTTAPPINGIAPAINTLGLTNLGLLAPNILSISTGQQRSIVLNEQPSPPPSSTGSNSPHQWISSPTSLYSPMMLLSPVTSVPSNPYEQLVYANCNGVHKDFNQNDPQMKLTLQSNNTVMVASNSSPLVSAPTLINRTSNTPSPCDLISSTNNVMSTPNVMPPPSVLPGSSIDDLEVHTMRAGNVSVNVVVPKTRSPSSSGGSVDLKGLNKPQSPLIMLENDIRNAHFQNGDRQSSESGAESDSSDKKAPGTDRPKPPPGFPCKPLNPPIINFDYEKKKLLATKAIQKKPVGETRNPTDYWAGLGFSKSMPDTVIREKLQQNNIRYKGPSMTTTYEASALEEDDGIDKDPWRNSKKLGTIVPPKPDDTYGIRQTGMNSFNGLCSGLNGTSLVDSGSKSIWSSKSDLCELLSKLGLGKYSDLFQQQEIDLSTFVTLTDQDLKELGISTFGARRKMLLAITDMNKRRSLFSATPGANNPFRTPNPVLATVRRQDIASQSGRW